MRALAATIVVLTAASVGADVSTAIDHQHGERREMSLRDAHRCWPRQHFKALSARDRAAVDHALAREADRLGTCAVSDALLRFERSYLQERNGRIHVYAEPPSIYQHPEDAEAAKHECLNFFGNDIPDDLPYWRATYDPRTDTFVELYLDSFNAHI